MQHILHQPATCLSRRSGWQAKLLLFARHPCCTHAAHPLLQALLEEVTQLEDDAIAAQRAAQG